jgi:hypothetical protein
MHEPDQAVPAGISAPLPGGWGVLPSDVPDLFSRLRALENAEVTVAASVGTGVGYLVEVPCATVRLRGRLRVEPRVDRFVLELDGWGAGSFAWFGRRKGRGRPDYWQIGVEYRPGDYPALAYFGTAAADGLEIRIRAPEPE